MACGKTKTIGAKNLTLDEAQGTIGGEEII
jgi:hypothetical protein